MLVLSRRPGEEILLPECQVVLRVVEIQGNRVRLGIAAPEHVRVFRRELWEALCSGACSGEAAREVE